METVRLPIDPIQAYTDLTINPGPLSERMYCGTPRTMNSSQSTSITSAAFSLRATRIAKHSRVNSSTTFSRRTLRPSCVRASTRS